MSDLRQMSVEQLCEHYADGASEALKELSRRCRPPAAEGTDDLFQKFDCDWGCGCGGRHCADEPCKQHRLEDALRRIPLLERELADRILAARPPAETPDAMTIEAAYRSRAEVDEAGIELMASFILRVAGQTGKSKENDDAE